ncbi:Tetraspanin-7 [Geodia barretti]|uniref:Tetraspanin n=1 Tax=Geodia barretti TaxID=519541 RepID=A0AA35VYM2_GEOBA|nr:Tetraspanin-7 [Geodia barretti]
MSSAMECLTKFNQLILIIVNIFVALLGICVMIVGSWAKADSKEFFLIADDDTEYTQVSVLLIVVGIFVLIIGVVGAVGALFASKAFGRIILVVYAISLGLLVVCEIAGGITAAVARNKVESVFRDSANSTFSKYNDSRDSSERDTWNQFQKDFKCCGVESYKDYRTVFKNDSVPVSCCDSRKIDDGENCTMVVQNVTNNANHYIYSKGCADAIVDSISKNLGVIAGCAIVFALFQVRVHCRPHLLLDHTIMSEFTVDHTHFS